MKRVLILMLLALPAQAQAPGKAAPAKAAPAKAAPAKAAPAKAAPAKAAAKQGGSKAADRTHRDNKIRIKPRCPRRPTEDQMRVFATLHDRQLALKHQKARQQAEDRRLEDLRRQILAQREELLKLQRELDEKLTERELAEAQARAQRLRKLVKIYEKMQAASASRAVQGMDRDLVVEMMLQMKPKVAAGIMNLLPGRTAARLSEEISDRKKGLIESLLEQVEEMK